MSKTVKVRIFVAVDTDGDWAACGARGENEIGDVIHCADGLNGERETHAWITAEIPIPEAAIEVAGTVEGSRTSEPAEWGV